MELSIMFFANDNFDDQLDKYETLLEVARRADAGGLHSIWTPERHFHPFGGGFPNPSVISAALASVTQRIHIRAGSVISPLHDEIRIAEEWSVVDNLSLGRIGISFGSGWNSNDFVLAPANYSNRKNKMFDQIATVRALWSGQSITRRNGAGKMVDVQLYPKPIQETLPLWITSSGNSDTFIQAGKIGAHMLTHLLLQDLETLSKKIRAYRESYLGPEGRGKVTLMLHTFIDENSDQIRQTVWSPFTKYLRSAVGLEQLASAGGGTVSGNSFIPAEEIPEDLIQELVELSFERYYKNSALIGTPREVLKIFSNLESYDIDEVACLIDFGINKEAMMRSLDMLIDISGGYHIKAKSGDGIDVP